MSVNITSEKLGNPPLVELLRKLTDCFAQIEMEFYVIGATARDIIILQLSDTPCGRRTRDLDIAIAIPDWDAFGKVETVLVTNGFVKCRDIRQRFYYGDYEMDVVPYGGVAKEDVVYWPTEEDIALSVKGFDSVLSEAVNVSIDDEFTIKVASMYGLFLLKLNAWIDRNLSTNKDVEDMSIILSNYFIANLSRDIHPEVYDWEKFNEYTAGAYWLAHDLVSILTIEQIGFYGEYISNEVGKEESVLINKVAEHCSGMGYDLAKEVWQTIADVFMNVVKNGKD